MHIRLVLLCAAALERASTAYSLQQQQQQQQQQGGLNPADTGFLPSTDFLSAGPTEEFDYHEEEEEQQLENGNRLRSAAGAATGARAADPASFTDATISEEEFERISSSMKPCFQSEDRQACGSRVKEEDYPGGLHCPVSSCCSRTVIERGSIGGWCSKSWVYCSSSLIYEAEFSYGTCNCSAFRNRCPAGSDCFDTDFGPYCKCQTGLVETEGDFVCTCLGGYVSKKLSHEREQCVFQY
ncbi:microneme protein MIC3, putative [Eimeria acervulina]|uniref:Microneme protein MIC3, putative n=1 Tax=Eimeria acervulina TaxID=5801 RepID=U6GM72_EIMAC|nr:microneme protein MIC3, putative [Eimeria acervulina]CDI80657.1 microneme protein MIC3, putative [Eimeria acervulina]